MRAWRAWVWLLVVLLSASGCEETSAARTVDETGPEAPPRPAAAPAEREQHPEPGPVLLLGADALDLEVLRPLVAAGRLPHFARLLEQGAHGVLLSEREMRSPALWTTIATGRPRDVHGIYDFITGSRFWPQDQRGGRQRLVTSRMREVPALWQMASRAGRRVAVVGWLNTWPAEKVDGVMVAPYVALGESKQVTIKGAVYPDERRQVHPPERWPALSELIVSPQQVPADLVASFAPPPGPALLRAYPILERYHRALRWSLANTLTMKRILLHLIERENPDLAMVYFEGSDSLAHRFWLFRDPPKRIRAQLRDAGLSTEHAELLAERYGGLLDRYYALLDEVLGALWQALGERARIVVVSDHGFTSWTGRYDLNPKVPFTGEHQLEGALLVGGPGIQPGRRLVGATLYDITPTVLDLLRIQLEAPFEGRSLAARLGVEPAGAATTAGGDPPTGHDDSDEEPDDDEAPFEREEIERLRSLGYVE
jgi:predicted AlkP superfamily phosphohydrolase/phosphomutase